MIGNYRIVFLLVWLIALPAVAVDVVLIYPRIADSTQVFTYPEQIDSTFVLGHISPPQGTLFINEQSVPYTDRGAFLAWLPLRKSQGLKSWDVVLESNGNEITSLSFPYWLASEVPASATTDTFNNDFFPHLIQVTQENAHTRTYLGGSYHLFPEFGCLLKAVGHKNGFFEFEIANDWTGFIEDRFVSISDNSTLQPVRIGNAECTQEDNTTICRFDVNRVLTWSAALSPDHQALRLMLYNTTAAIDRIRYTVDDTFLEDITWEQLPTGLALQFRCRGPIQRGFQVTTIAGELVVTICQPYSKREQRLKGKTIILDPGHGGKAEGSIGPLGTKEKDITLKWAEILSGDLIRHGAVVKLTRFDDRDLDLYSRIDYAKSQKADFFISLHGNALPDGLNPFLRHGSGTYYYQAGSRSAAAIIHRHLVKASGLRDDGLWDANLAVVRPTAFPAVLLEAAYLIYPEEEELLQSDEFLRKLSKGIVRGLQEYFQRNR